MTLREAYVTEAFSSFSRFFDSDIFSDLTIRCGDRKWKAHKFMLCSQCEYFSACCEDPRFVEGQSRIVELNDDEPFAVDAMLRFIYTRSYAGELAGEDHGVGPAVFHASVFVIAEKYLLPGLQDLAAENFAPAIEQACPDGASGEGGDEEDFSAAIVIAYAAARDPERMLRHSIFEVVEENSRVLFYNARSMCEPFQQRPFLKAMDLVPQLMKELVATLSARRETWDGPTDLQQYKYCSGCGVPRDKRNSWSMSFCPECGNKHLWDMGGSTGSFCGIH